MSTAAFALSKSSLGISGAGGFMGVFFEAKVSRFLKAPHRRAGQVDTKKIQ
jgi:hypothetical protein